MSGLKKLRQVLRSEQNADLGERTREMTDTASDGNLTIRPYELKWIEKERFELDSIEFQIGSKFDYMHMDVNKFWEQYNGVVDLSSKSCSLTELVSAGKGIEILSHPPMFGHGILKESMDRFLRACSLYLYFGDELTVE